MFFKKKKVESAGECDYHAFAIAAIENELEQATTDAGFAFVHGMAEMAYTLGAITLNERAAYTTTIHNKKQENKAKADPVYIKKGVYEYRGFYLLKDLAADEKATGGAIWSVQKIGECVMMQKNLKFADARRYIDSLL